MQALPADIRNLSKYYLPKQIFVCTCIILIFFLIWTIGMFLIWAWRSKKHIHNYQYVVDHNIRRQYQHAKKTFKQKMQRQRQQQNQMLESENGSSNGTKYTPQLQQSQMVYNRLQSRILEFVSLSVIVAININAFTCNIMEVVAYMIAAALFVVFNVFRVADSKSIFRLLFFIPLIVAYIPFFVFKKQLKTL